MATIAGEDSAFICLVAPDLADTMLESLDKFRDRSIMTDATICVGDQEFPCHKLVLSGCSDVFYNIFLENSKVQRVHMTAISADTLKQLLDFVYKGKVVVQHGEVRKLHSAAKLFRVRRLSQICEDLQGVPQRTEDAAQSVTGEAETEQSVSWELSQSGDSVFVTRSVSNRVDSGASSTKIPETRIKKEKAAMNESGNNGGGCDGMEWESGSMHDNHCSPVPTHAGTIAANGQTDSVPSCDVPSNTEGQVSGPGQVVSVKIEPADEYEGETLSSNDFCDESMDGNVEFYTAIQISSAEAAVQDTMMDNSVEYYTATEQSGWRPEQLDANRDQGDNPTATTTESTGIVTPLTLSTFLSLGHDGNHSRKDHHMAAVTEGDGSSGGSESNKSTVVDSEQTPQADNRPLSDETSTGSNSTTSTHIYLNPSNSKYPHRCQKCGQYFKCPLLFQLHETQHELGLSNQTCPLCRVKFSSFPNLGNHFKRFHRHDIKKAENINALWGQNGSEVSPSDTQSPESVKTFTNPLNSKFPYRCQQCGQFFRYMWSFQLHKRQHDLGLSTRTCPTCGKEFSTFMNLGKHFKEYHSSEMTNSGDSWEVPQDRPQGGVGVDGQNDSTAFNQVTVSGGSSVQSLQSFPASPNTEGTEDGGDSLEHTHQGGLQHDSTPGQNGSNAEIDTVLLANAQNGGVLCANTQSDAGVSDITLGTILMGDITEGDAAQTIGTKSDTVLITSIQSDSSENCEKSQNPVCSKFPDVQSDLESQNGSQNNSQVDEQSDVNEFSPCGQTSADGQFIENHKDLPNRSFRRYRYPFICQECGQGFNLIWIFEIHKKQHDLGLPSLICPVCRAEFTRKAALRTHCKKYHLEEEEANTESGAEVSSQSFDGESSSQIDQISTGREVIKDHQVYQNPVNSKYPHRCPVCGKYLRSWSRIKLHERQHQLGLSTSTCPVCRWEFSSEGSLGTHLKRFHRDILESAETDDVVHGDESESSLQDQTFPGKFPNRRFSKFRYPFCCQDCGQCFKSLWVFNFHKKQHEFGLSNLTCPVCRQEFSMLKIVAAHFKNCHMGNIEDGKSSDIECQDDSQNGSKMDDQIDMNESLSSDQANMESSDQVSQNNSHTEDRSMYSQSDQLSTDSDIAESDTIYINPPNSKFPHRCQECGQYFMCPLLLQLHQKQHELGLSKKTCPLCLGIYASFVNLVTHFRTVHKGDLAGAENIDVSLENTSQNDEGEGEQNDVNGCSPGDGKFSGSRKIFTNPPNSKFQYRCQECGQFFKCTLLFRLHNRQHELGLSNQTCPVCLEHLSNYLSVSSHFKRDHNARELNADLDGVSDRISSQSDSDQMSTDNDNSESNQIFFNPPNSKFRYRCPECGQYFKLLLFLQLHKKQHELGLSSQTCPLCRWEFSSFWNMIIHFRKFHKGDLSSEESRAESSSQDGRMATEKPSVGSKCSRNDEISTDSVSDSPERCSPMRPKFSKFRFPFCCRECGQSFKSSWVFQFHKKQHELGLPNLTCPECLSEFSTLMGLRNHFRKFHYGKEASAENSALVSTSDSQN